MGSAAFNLLVITAVCVVAITEGTKQVKELKVYAITATTSVLAYVWLLFILIFNSKDVITLAEALTTFGFFWVLLLLAYAADKNFFRAASEAVAPSPRPSKSNLQPEEKEEREKERERQQAAVRRLLEQQPEEAAAPNPQLNVSSATAAQLALVLQDGPPLPRRLPRGAGCNTAGRLGSTHTLTPPSTPPQPPSAACCLLCSRRKRMSVAIDAAVRLAAPRVGAAAIRDCVLVCLRLSLVPAHLPQR